MSKQRSDGSKSGITAATAVARQLDPSTENPEERERRIAELQRRYRDGTYRVDSARLAASIIDKHLDR